MGESEGSITRLVPQLRDRDALAIEKIWRRYVDRIRGAARPVIAGLSPGAGDDEDVAQSAFHSFCQSAAAGRLPPIGSRDQLWRLLFTFTRRKAVDRVRRELRLRRGGRKGAVNDPDAVNRAYDSACSPIEFAEFQEALDDLMQKLAETGDARLGEIARLRLEGASNQEVADELGLAVRTIQRKLHLLERLWSEQE
jgi:RNA polymerase sigma factor (sigma-70 family)